MSYTYVSNAPGTCGLSVYYGFNQPQGSIKMYGKRMSGLTPTGAGFAVVGFINTKNCRDAYALFCTKFKVVYQSPVRVNRNSRKKFFFIILDTEQQGATS